MPRVSAARSHVGLKREANEDFCCVDDARSIYVVADGLGGHVAGRVASEAGVAAFVAACAPRGDESRLAAVRRAVREANAAILGRAGADPALAGMGTTLVTLVFHGDERAVLAHVGDSRAYVLRAGKLQPLTLDHSRVVDMITYQRVPEERLRDHPQRHVITRALGVHASVEPDVAELRVRPGDVFLLCSDGITGMLEPACIEEVLRDAALELDTAAGILIDLANEAGGEDNATAVLVRQD